jgi:predicted amidohydrolase
MMRAANASVKMKPAIQSVRVASEYRPIDILVESIFMNLRISLCQFNIQVGNVPANLQKAADWIAEAAGRGSQIVLLPELWSTGYALDRARELASPIPAGLTAEISALAKTHQVWVGGSTLEKSGDQVYNTFALYAPTGELAAAYRKIHLFRLMQEDRWLGAGSQPVSVDLGFTQASLAICYDLRFPELFRGYAVKGVRLLLIPAEWPMLRIEHWRTLLKARAIENQVIVAAVNACGDSAGTVFGGHSAVIDAWGEVLAEAGEDACLLTADVDLSSPDSAREKLDILRDRRPDVYG